MSGSVKYKCFAEHLRKLRHLHTTAELLDWDQKVLMPGRAATGRAEQIATLSELLHRELTEKWFVELVDDLSGVGVVDSEAMVNVQQVKRFLSREMRVPADLVRARSEAASLCHHRWLEARSLNKFSIVAANLTELWKLTREYAEARKDREEDIYDALIDLYEPEGKAKTIQILFDQLAVKLKDLLNRIVTSERYSLGRTRLNLSLSKDQQREFFLQTLQTIGFDLNAGRLDETVHPFCATVGLHDVRLTTRYSEGFFPALLALIHEAGHGLYEQGLREDCFGLPLGEACSLGMHESQSLLWEKHIGRSREYWQQMWPVLKNLIGTVDQGINVESIYQAINWVEPSLNRVNADEVTYSLHVIIRFELERALCSGSLSIADLPGAWNEGYRKYLNISPPDDLSGVLQDTHWYGGAFGYFPTYTIGAVYAAELYNYARQSLISGADYRGLLSWLGNTVYKVGRSQTSEDLMSTILGRRPSSQALIDHLTTRYSELYNLS